MQMDEHENHRERIEKLTPEKREEFFKESAENIKEFRKQTNDEWAGMGIFGIGNDKAEPEGSSKRRCFAHICCSPEAFAHFITGVCEGNTEIIDAIFIGLLANETNRQHIVQRLMMTAANPMVLTMMMQSLQEMGEAAADADTEEKEEKESAPEAVHSLEDLMAEFKKGKDDGEKE